MQTNFEKIYIQVKLIISIFMPIQFGIWPWQIMCRMYPR